MKTAIKYLLLLWCIIASSQSFDSISKHYKQQQKQQIDTLINYAKTKHSSAWLNLLPTVNYDIDRSNVNLSISLANFSNYYQQKQRNKIELAKLQQTLEIKLENKLIQLENEYLTLQLEVKLQEADYINSESELTYILLKKEQFIHHELILEDWLKIKQTYTQKLYKHRAAMENLQLQIQQFQNKLKHTGVLKISRTLKRLLDIYKDLKLQIDA